VNLQEFPTISFKRKEETQLSEIDTAIAACIPACWGTVIDYMPLSTQIVLKLPENKDNNIKETSKLYRITQRCFVST